MGIADTKMCDVQVLLNVGKLINYAGTGIQQTFTIRDVNPHTHVLALPVACGPRFHRSAPHPD